MGWSKGAEAALLLASTYPKTFNTAVAYSPTPAVWSGINRRSKKLHSSWTQNGKPVPFVAYEPQPNLYNRQKKTVYLADGYLKPILEGKGDGKAAIRVGQIAGPVLLLSGTDDKMWPADLFASQIMARLKKHHHPYNDKSLCYKGAGHLIVFWPYRPTITTNLKAGPVRILFGGHQIAYAYQEANSWPRILSFLHNALN